MCNDTDTPCYARRLRCCRWLVAAAFIKATQNVLEIGLSFGGVCFFETGVTPTPDTFTSEQFSSTFAE